MIEAFTDVAPDVEISHTVLRYYRYTVTRSSIFIGVEKHETAQRTAVYR